tara:strand:+ start:891 stop:1652 length:762 start_codon:yes stop_codon:yes gene_type:complete
MASVKVPYPGAGALEKALGLGSTRDALGGSAFDLDVMEDSFLGDALNARYPAAKTNGTSAAVTHTEHNQYGYVDLVTGTTDDGYAGQGFTQNWDGDRGFLFETLFETPAAITTLKFEAGISDADDDAGAVNQKATTTTATAGDFAVFVLDTDDDANFAFVSAKGGTVVGSQDLLAAAVSTVYYAAIRVDGDNVEAWLTPVGGAMIGAPIAGHGGAAGIEGGTAVGPWAFAQARAGSASRTMKWLKWRMTAPAW